MIHIPAMIPPFELLNQHDAPFRNPESASTYFLSVLFYHFSATASTYAL